MFNGWIPYKINDVDIKPDEYIDIGDCIGSCRKSDVGEYVPDFNNGSSKFQFFYLIFYSAVELGGLYQTLITKKTID